MPRLARGDSGLHPALLAYKELYGWLPNRAQQQIILNAEIEDERLWRRCLWRWAARGYNPRRLDGVLEWYRDPDLMEEKRRPSDSVTADTALKLGGGYAPMPAPVKSASQRAQEIIDSMPADVIALMLN